MCTCTRHGRASRTSDAVEMDAIVCERLFGAKCHHSLLAHLTELLTPKERWRCRCIRLTWGEWHCCVWCDRRRHTCHAEHMTLVWLLLCCRQVPQVRWQIHGCSRCCKHTSK